MLGFLLMLGSFLGIFSFIGLTLHLLKFRRLVKLLKDNDITF